MSAAPFLVSDVGRPIVSSLGGTATITGYTSTTVVTATIEEAFSATPIESGNWTVLGSPLTTCTPSVTGPVGAAVTLTLAAAGWRAEDVGKYVSINGGLVRITVFSSNLVVTGFVEQELASVVAAPAWAWILMASMWGGTNGWPRCGTIHEARLWLGGSPGYPTTLWGSTIGEYFDFTLGVFDDEALSYALGSGDYNAIRHLVQARGLVALTYGGEFSIRGGQEKPITPTNIAIKDQSNYGSSEVMPHRVGSEFFFTQRAGRKVRALSPGQFDTETYGAPDMSVLSEHITETGVVDMAYQQEPDSNLYVVRADGQLGTLTADREQDVFGWARQLTQGQFESACVIPTATGEVAFFAVARVVNGVLVRYMEMADPTLHTDSAVTGVSAAGSTVWTGLGHLANRKVTIKGDKVVMPSQYVTAGGQITTERAVKDLEVGLHYNTTILTLTPEVNGPTGSAQGAAMSIHEVWVRLRDTMGCTVNLQEIAFRKLGAGLLDVAPQPFTGDKQAGNLGWGNGVAQTLIQQTLPYPFHLLAVITKLSVNDG